MDEDNGQIIAEDYAMSLNDLTFNSRPIIDNLTTIAKENIGVADKILEAITNRIYKCIPAYKLYALYLLDSVCKYVGEPYNVLVGDDIFKIFSHVYMLVGEDVRLSLGKIYESWKIAKTRGTSRSLFPSEQLDKIGAFLAQAGHNSAKILTNHDLIDDIQTLIPLYQSRLAHTPDSKLADRLNALKQLKSLLLSQAMKPNELQAVQAQLNNIRQQELSTQLPTPVPNTPAHTPHLMAQPLSSKADDLFHALIASGLVTTDQSLKPGSKPTYDLVFPKIKYHPPSNKLSANDDLQDILNQSNMNKLPRTEYERVKFIELTKIQIKVSESLQTFINSNSPSAHSVSLLYDSKPSKCGICGKRFTTDEIGTNRKRLHLDWHFRINKKASSGGSNVLARNWYLDDHDWVEFKDDELLEFSTNTSSTTQIKTTESPSVAETTFVVVPSSTTNMNNKCLICREQVSATYNDDIGEWCWLNCIRPPGEGKNSRKIVHSSCYNEANKKRSADNDLNSKVKRERL